MVVYNVMIDGFRVGQLITWKLSKAYLTEAQKDMKFRTGFNYILKLA